MPALNNAKHETFCQLVAKGETNTKAYLCCGYSKQGAAQSANKLRKKFHIQQRLSELSVTAVRVIEQKFESDVARIVEELCGIAFCDPGEIVDDAGNLLPLQRERFVTLATGDDQRVTEARLTAKGRKAIAQALPLWQQVQGEIVERLGAGSVQQMRDFAAAALALNERRARASVRRR